MRFLPVMEPEFSGNEARYLSECIESGWVSSIGEFVTRFETAFAEYCDTKYALSTNNGTAALHLALMTLDLAPEDQVIIPDLTFVATANVVKLCGAELVLCDIDPHTWNLDLNRALQLMGPRTKAIIPVHLYGLPALSTEFLSACRERGVTVIEDAAEACGASFKGQKVGSCGDFGCFSFFGNKIITCGEGGMLTTNSTELYEKARLFRNHGMDDKRKYWHHVIGHNFRLTNLQAAVGLAQLERIDYFLTRRKEVSHFYMERLSHLPGISFAEWDSANYEHVFWLASLLVGPQFPLTRDELIKHLAEKQIDARPFFYPVHILPPYLHKLGDFATCNRISARGLNLPSGPSLTTAELEYICATITAAAQGAATK